MSQKVAEVGNLSRMREALEQLKRDLAKFEALLPPAQPANELSPNDDIFVEMASVTAHAPQADDSREAIYTRMPGE